jgi:hypothetical protein
MKISATIWRAGTRHGHHPCRSDHDQPGGGGQSAVELRVEIRQVLRAEFKGEHERLDIFLVTWEQDGGASTRIGIPAYRNLALIKDELVLKYRDQTTSVNKAHRMVVLGRARVARSSCRATSPRVGMCVSNCALTNSYSWIRAATGPMCTQKTARCATSHVKNDLARIGDNQPQQA